MILIKQNNQLIPVGLTVGKGVKTEPWVRPNDWLPIPAFDSTKDEVYILVGVGKADINCIYFDAQTKSGTGTIDWGDGSPTEIITTTNTTFHHNWSYEDIPDSTYTEHNKTKQVLIHISCDRDTFRGIDFNKTHYYTNEDEVEVAYNYIVSNLIYEVKADCENVTKFNVQGTSSSAKVRLRNLESFDWKGEITITSMSYMFGECYSLQSILQLDTSKVTNMENMFYRCYSLQSIPQLDTSSVKYMSNMFQNCYSLQSIPQLDTSSVTYMNFMFSGCYSLQSIPQLDTSSVTNMNNIFQNCYSLQTIPQLDTSSVTNMSSMFNTCSSLQTIPQLDTSSATNMSGMFTNCSSLQTIPRLDTSSVTSMGSMFSYCYSLQTIPQLDTSSVTDMSNMFTTCYSLQSIPQLDTSSAIYMSNMFYICYPLQKLITYNAGASSQASITLSNLTYSTMLTKQQLVDLFNSVSVAPSGTTRTLQLDSTLQGYLSNCYVKDSGVLDTYILPTRDTSVVSGKTYYTYDDVTDEYMQVTPDFTTDTFYYELVTATWNKYIICESTDTGAMLALDYITNVKGWTVT